VVVDMFIRDPDKHVDASGETKGFWYRIPQQPVARRADLVKQFAFEYSNRDSTKAAARFRSQMENLEIGKLEAYINAGQEARVHIAYTALRAGDPRADTYGPRPRVPCGRSPDPRPRPVRAATTVSAFYFTCKNHFEMKLK
jgi:hypothetical protein